MHMEQFSDYIALIGVLLTLITLVIPLYKVIAFNIERRKKLQYSLITNSPIMSNEGLQISDEVFPDIEKSKLKNLYILEYKFENTTKNPITENSIQQYLTLKFPEETNLFTPEITYKNCKSYKPTAVANKNKIIIEKFTLNPKDYFTIRFLANLKDKINEDDISVEAYITNINLKRIKIYPTSDPVADLIFSIVFLSSALAFSIALFLNTLFQGNEVIANIALI